MIIIDIDINISVVRHSPLQYIINSTSLWHLVFNHLWIRLILSIVVDLIILVKIFISVRNDGLVVGIFVINLLKSMSSGLLESNLLLFFFLVLLADSIDSSLDIIHVINYGIIIIIHELVPFRKPNILRVWAQLLQLYFLLLLDLL